MCVVCCSLFVACFELCVSSCVLFVVPWLYECFVFCVFVVALVFLA